MMQSAISKKATPAGKWSSLRNEMTTSKIDNSQRTAAKVAGWSGLLTFAIVVFGNYVLLNPLIVSGNVAATAQNIGASNAGSHHSCLLFDLQPGRFCSAQRALRHSKTDQSWTCVDRRAFSFRVCVVVASCAAQSAQRTATPE